MDTRKNAWMVGLLGFLGFLGLHEPIYYLFFIFFGGFRYYWWEKIGTASDERLVENKNKAAAIAFKVTFIAGLIITLITNLVINDVHLLYQIGLIVFSMSFAVGINLWAYLTYQYEFGDA